MPLAPRSVLSEHIALGAVRTEHLGVSTTVEQVITPLVTTSLAFVGVASIVIRTTNLGSLLVVPLVIHVKHSVAGATFRMEWDLYVDAAGSSGITISRMADTAPLAVAEAWYPFTSVSTQDLVTAGASFGPGEHLLKLWVRNNTAGTLTVGGPTGPTSRYFSAFLVGAG